VAAAPFATTIGTNNDGAGKGFNNDNTSDYGDDDGDSESLSSIGKHDNDDDDNSSIRPTTYDGDLYENLFTELLTYKSQYREPGTIRHGLLGPVLVQDLDHPTSLPTLIAHSDDKVFCRCSISISPLSSAQIYCISIGTFCIHSVRHLEFNSGWNLYQKMITYS
jgi:hypothetical protein